MNGIAKMLKKMQSHKHLKNSNKVDQNIKSKQSILFFLFEFQRHDSFDYDEAFLRTLFNLQFWLKWFEKQAKFHGKPKDILVTHHYSHNVPINKWGPESKAKPRWHCTLFMYLHFIFITQIGSYGLAIRQRLLLFPLQPIKM